MTGIPVDLSTPFTLFNGSSEEDLSDVDQNEKDPAYTSQSTEGEPPELPVEGGSWRTGDTIEQFGFDPYQVERGLHIAGEGQPGSANNSDTSDWSGWQPNTLRIRRLAKTHLPLLYDTVEFFLREYNKDNMDRRSTGFWPAEQIDVPLGRSDHSRFSSNDWIKIRQTHSYCPPFQVYGGATMQGHMYQFLPSGLKRVIPDE